jgi:hypothetical protein
MENNKLSNGNNKSSSEKFQSETKRNIRGLKLGVIISKLETFADIKQGRFRRIFNRHFRPSGI